MRLYATEISCIARSLERVLDAAQDERPELHAIVVAALAYAAGDPLSIEDVEELLRNTQPRQGTAYDRIHAAAFCIACALKGAAWYPLPALIQLHLYGALSLIDEITTMIVVSHSYVKSPNRN